jgi:hypothetical protein
MFCNTKDTLRRTLSNISTTSSKSRRRSTINKEYKKSEGNISRDRTSTGTSLFSRDRTSTGTSLFSRDDESVNRAMFSRDDESVNRAMLECEANVSNALERIQKIEVDVGNSISQVKDSSVSAVRCEMENYKMESYVLKSQIATLVRKFYFYFIL